jgi:hypothetical protein
MGTHVSHAPDRRVGVAAETRSYRGLTKSWLCQGRVGCTGIKKISSSALEVKHQAPGMQIQEFEVKTRRCRFEEPPT